jgi:hypothetical protein
VPLLCELIYNNFNSVIEIWGGPRGGAVGWGTALQAGRLWVRFPTMSLDFLIDIIIPVDSASNRSEYQECFLGVKAPGA